MMNYRLSRSLPQQWMAYFCILMTFLMMFLPFSVQGTISAKQASHVRVQLTAYENLSNLEISVYGNYTLDHHISFQQGSTLKLSVVQGKVHLQYEGLVYLGGETMVFKRFETDPGKENGLRFQGQTNLFPGDLQVSAKDGSLQLILILPIEEYLQGVVPYEMDDGFPLEALKAQAIAARTYTLAHLDASKPYDMVDNTNDQVYRGLNENKANSIQAVKDTQGMVVVYQGKLASCFYTASNGGVTESAYNAWGREQIPYLTIQKDPYDVENPLSIRKSAMIAMKEHAGMNQESETLYQFLQDKLKQQLISAGFLQEGYGYDLISIERIQPHTTRFGGEDGVMKYLRFDVTAAVETPSAAQADAEINLTQQQSTTNPNPAQAVTVIQNRKVSIDIQIFPDLERLLALSINRNENEIVSVNDDEKYHHILFGRYGHGVGMSQRGAEWMAKHYQWDYRQILRFYYPGTEILTYDTQVPPLPTLNLNYGATPGLAPTVTPRPTLMPLTLQAESGQKVIIVDGVAENSSLNLRAQADYLGDIVTRLYFGQKLILIKEYENGWMEVKTDTVTGFIRHEFVSVVE